MTAAERRAHVVDSAVPLLRERGRSVSTREIAAAAGIAEGTIFRVFASKDELVDACVSRAFDTSTPRTRLRQIDLTLPLAGRLTAGVEVMQAHLRDVFALVMVLHSSGRQVGGDATGDDVARRRATEEVDADLLRLIGPDVALLRVDPQLVVEALRMLTLASAHPFLGESRAQATELVDLVLRGALGRADSGPTTRGNACSSD